MNVFTLYFTTTNKNIISKTYESSIIPQLNSFIVLNDLLWEVKNVVYNYDAKRVGIVLEEKGKISEAIIS